MSRDGFKEGMRRAVLAGLIPAATIGRVIAQQKGVPPGRVVPPARRGGKETCSYPPLTA